MAWVKQVLTGAEFTMEAINMMCFMMEEAAQSTYCLPMMPNAGAWLSFYLALHMSMLNSDIRFENYKRLLALGIDPRPGKNKTKP
jgi:hypothetical protein